MDARQFGTEMFEASSDVGDVPAADIIRRDAKEYEVSHGRRMCVAQIETVGKRLLSRRPELLEAMEGVRERMDYVLYALMITDIVEKGTELLVAGDADPGRARLRHRRRRRRPGPPRRDEPQEAGRAEAAGRLLGASGPRLTAGSQERGLR